MSSGTEMIIQKELANTIKRNRDAKRTHAAQQPESRHSHATLMIDCSFGTSRVERMWKNVACGHLSTSNPITGASLQDWGFGSNEKGCEGKHCLQEALMLTIDQSRAPSIQDMAQAHALPTPTHLPATISDAKMHVDAHTFPDTKPKMTLLSIQ
jgi:hypothetical protein